MNKKLLYGGSIILLVVLFLAYYYMRTPRQRAMLAKLMQGGTSQEEKQFLGDVEANKMTSPDFLKNTIMSLKKLEKPSYEPNKFSMFGGPVGPEGNGTIDIQRIIIDKNKDEVLFVAQDGIHIKAAKYKGSTGEVLSDQQYQGSIDVLNTTQQPPWNIGDGTGYKIKHKGGMDMGNVVKSMMLYEPNNFSMFGGPIGPEGNGTIDIQKILIDKNKDEVMFVAQDGMYVKAAKYKGSTGGVLNDQHYQGSIDVLNTTQQPPWNVGDGTGYKIKHKGGMDMDNVVKSMMLQDSLYPDSIREGLFYLKLAGSNQYLGGMLNNLNQSELNFNNMDMDLQNKLFKANSFTDLSNLKDKFSAIPLMLNYVNQDDNTKEYTFTIRDGRGSVSNIKYFGVADSQSYIIPGQKYVFIDLKSGRMPYRDGGDNLYKMASGWTKDDINDFYRTYMFENTGLDSINNYGSSFYIYDVVSGKYLRRKPDGAIDAVSNKNGFGNETRWYLGWNVQNSNDGYHIRTVVNMDFLNFDKGNSILITVPADKHDNRAFGIIREVDFPWTKYRYWRIIGWQGGRYRWTNTSWEGFNVADNAILDTINSIGYAQDPFNCFSTGGDGDQTIHGKDSEWGMENNARGGGQFICVNKQNLKQNTMSNIPSLRLGGTQNDKFTFFYNNGNLYVKYGDRYLSYTLKKDEKIISFTSSIDQAISIELVPVLNVDDANTYLQASYKWMNTSGVSRDSLSAFCGTNIRFPDGTLKLYPNSIEKDDKGLPVDPIERVFESICACHMNKDFYKNALCSDEMIKLNFGIDPENPKNKSLLDAIRDDMKCMKPNCTFEKCRNVITNEKNYIKMNQQSTSDNITEGCGSGVICITNQNINIGEGAVLQDTTINAESISQCGGERISKPQMLDVGDFIWLDDSKTILGKEQKCFITQDGVSRTVDSKTTGCSDITTKSYIEFNNPEKIRESVDPTTGLKTISLKGITINESSLDVNTIKEFIHEKLKDMLNLPEITDIQVSYSKPALVITYFDEIPEKSNNKSTPEQTTPKKSNNMIYIIILVLLILGAGGYFIMKKK